MTKVITITNNCSNNFFQKMQKTAEVSALAFEKRIREMPGGNRDFKALDKCLSYHGDKPCYLYIIDECRTTYKCDPNVNCIQLIVNTDD